MDKIKFQLNCEVCGTPAFELKIIRHFLYCKECAEAKERRDRFKREESEWNRGEDQKDTK